jgi:hypothetical protein
MTRLPPGDRDRSTVSGEFTWTSAQCVSDLGARRAGLIVTDSGTFIHPGRQRLRRHADRTVRHLRY